MRAIVINEYVKQASDLKVSTLPDPSPKQDEYLVQVHAAAANFFDILQVQGQYQTQPPFPWIAGAEFSGIILQSPSSSSPFQPGDYVFGACQGSFATRLCVREHSLLPLPKGWSFAEAAGLFVTAPTSYAALVIRAGVVKGDWILVHASAGGVGLAAIQVAKALGATVIATASTTQKLSIAQSWGADHVVSYMNPDWPSRVKALTPKGRGVDVVFDPVGLVEKSTKCTAWNGRILVVGFAAGTIEKMSLNKVLLKNIAVVGIFWGAYALNQPDIVPRVWQGIMSLIAHGKFRPSVFTDESFVGLDSVKHALTALASRRTWGKVVITIPPEEASRL